MLVACNHRQVVTIDSAWNRPGDLACEELRTNVVGNDCQQERGTPIANSAIDLQNVSLNGDSVHGGFRTIHSYESYEGNAMANQRCAERSEGVHEPLGNASGTRPTMTASRFTMPMLFPLAAERMGRSVKTTVASS